MMLRLDLLEGLTFCVQETSGSCRHQKEVFWATSRWISSEERESTIQLPLLAMESLYFGEVRREVYKESPNSRRSSDAKICGCAMYNKICGTDLSVKITGISCMVVQRKSLEAGQTERLSVAMHPATT